MTASIDDLLAKPQTDPFWHEFFFDLDDQNNSYRQRAKFLILSGAIDEHSTFQDMWRIMAAHQ